VPLEQLLTESPVPLAKPGGSQLPKAPVPSTPRSFAEEEERRYSGELTLDERAKALLREYPPERLEDLARIVGVFYLKSDYTLGVVKDELRRRAHDPEEVAQLLARLHEEARLLTEALNYLIEQRREGGI
jgi:hypothetical protein